MSQFLLVEKGDTEPYLKCKIFADYFAGNSMLDSTPAAQTAPVAHGAALPADARAAPLCFECI